MFAYEKLVDYQKAYAINQEVYRFLKSNKSIPIYARDQLGRACFSIMLNIAEGTAKFSRKDRKNFYIVARASIFEGASLVSFLSEEQEITSELRIRLLKSYEELSRMLFALIVRLKDGTEK